LQKIADFERPFPKNSVFRACFMRRFTEVSDHSGGMFGRSVSFFLVIGDRPQVFAPSQKRPPASLPKGTTQEFFMISHHYVQENKATYNFWKKFENGYLIEYKRVISQRHAADVAKLHYVIEN
jgi:hypothetical protein